MARYCPKCAKVFPGEAKLCPECGAVTRDNEELPSLNMVAQARFNEKTWEVELERLFEIIEGQGD